MSNTHMSNPTGSPASPRNGLMQVLHERRSSSGLIALACFISMFNDGFRYGAVIPVLPFSLTSRSVVRFEFVQSWLSYIYTAFGIAIIIGALMVGNLAPRTSSHKFPVIFGLALALLGTFLLSVGRSPWTVLVGRALQGLSSPFIRINAVCMVAQGVDGKRVRFWIGLILVGYNLGLIVSPILCGTLYDTMSYDSIFGIVFAITFFEVLCHLTIREKSVTKTRPTQTRSPSYGTHGPPSMIEAGLATPPPFPQYLPTSPKNSILTTIDPTQTPSPSAFENRDIYFKFPTETTSLITSLSRASTFPIQTSNSSKTVDEPGVFATVFAIFNSQPVLIALSGCFLYTTLTTSFDAILPQKVFQTFDWGPTECGIALLALTLPSLPKRLTDRFAHHYETRRTALVGFGMCIPSLTLLSLLVDDTGLNKILLYVYLSITGMGLNFVLASLSLNIYEESSTLAVKHPDSLGKHGTVGALAKVYAAFVAVSGVAYVLGSGIVGLLLYSTSWQAACAALGIFMTCAAVLAIVETESADGFDDDDCVSDDDECAIVSDDDDEYDGDDERSAIGARFSSDVVIGIDAAKPEQREPWQEVERGRSIRRT